MAIACTLLEAHAAASSTRASIDTAARVTLRKCVGPAGDVAFQSSPCDAGRRELWSREERLADAAPPPTRASGGRVATLPRARPARGAKRSGARAQCDAARREAAQRRDREWNRLKFDDLSKLDAWVAERCR